ncbi:MAG TPA: glycosyltransferase family 39 protein, partial [Gaiellaceae bacterium]|nr:glycosyltransferase family 39 protein [Gaiellaceae bacterium]
MSRRQLAAAAGLVALYVIAVGSLIVRAPLWNDELYTWYFAQLSTMRDVWDALETGVEQLPPAYYALIRASLAVFGDNEVGLRIPSLLGFLLACVCVYAVVARRTGAWYGLVAALVLLAGGATPYAWEARPYALVLGFAGAAVLCHQLRTDGVRPRLAVIGLALALAGATAVHYYGALVVVP